VASPLDCSWDQLRKALRTMWAQTTAASNWMMTNCTRATCVVGAKRRCRRWRACTSTRRRVRVSLACHHRLWPASSRVSSGSIERCGTRVVWTAAASLPTHRYPTPFPVPSQGWHATIEADQAIVSMRIGDDRYRLRLKRGPQFRRQIAAFRQIVEGDAVAGELAIYDRDGVMVKMAVWLPRAEDKGPRADVLTVQTGKDNLLVPVNSKDEALWRYNGDHLRRWAAEHRKQLQRWSEDQKYEQRPVAAFAHRREAASRKFRDRMNSATHEIAALLAGGGSPVDRAGSVEWAGDDFLGVKCRT
jgi:hypothetical protein